MKITSRPKIEEPSLQKQVDDLLQSVEKAFEYLCHYENARTILDASRTAKNIITPTALPQYEMLIKQTMNTLQAAKIITGFSVDSPREMAGSTYEVETWSLSVKFKVLQQPFVASMKFIYTR